MALVEIAHYKLREGASEQTLFDAEGEIQRIVAPKHPGYVSRELLKTTDGGYVLIMKWENQQAAESWNQTLFASDAGRKLGPLVEPSSMTMERVTSLKP